MRTALMVALVLGAVACGGRARPPATQAADTAVQATPSAADSAGRAAADTTGQKSDSARKDSVH
jgi:hypothetical protein